jgi:hypothetical protein
MFTMFNFSKSNGLSYFQKTKLYFIFNILSYVLTNRGVYEQLKLVSM